MPDQKPPLATYTEQHPQVRRHFALYADRVLVHAHWRAGRDHEMTVPLNSLRDEPRQVQIRYKWYRYAGWVIAAGLMILAIAVYQAGGKVTGLAPWLGIALAAAGAIVRLVTRKPVIFARFDPRQGRGGLDIARTSDPQAFDEFVQHVRRQIRKQQRG